MKIASLSYIIQILFKLKSYHIFIFSILICAIFYGIEGLIGIDRFYHPDSSHYLTKYMDYSLKSYLNNPKIILNNGYYHLTNLLNDNYYFLIVFNFILYSFTNILIYQKVFKKYFNKLSNIKLFLLLYILFLDPFRLHLASHILKETFLIFLMTLIIVSNLKIIKIIYIYFLDIFRPNSWIYILIYLTFSNMKKIIDLKYIRIIFLLLIISFLILVVFNKPNLVIFFDQQINFYVNKMEHFYYKQMPLRSYDNISQFKEFGFPIGFILKNISWPLMLISGTFIFFVSSLIFKILGIIIFINNLIIYIISKKTFISFGLIIILILISIYTSSYTSMFRYSYIAIYSSIIYFFLNLNLDRKKPADL